MTCRLPFTSFALLLLVWLSACAAPRPAAEAPAAEAAKAPPAEHEAEALANENLNSVLWAQTSVEYAAIARQTYALAEVMLRRALEDSVWTASVEQGAVEGYAALPPAVVLDVDETALDNSAYQARLVEAGDTYDRASWQAWVREERATPLPGARAFTRLAQRLGVEVFYVTNRRHAVEDATRSNLRALGFYVSPERDVILTRGEAPGWGGDKTSRRAALAQDYRLLLLVGDNFGDFVGGVDVSVRERERLAARYAKYWGSRWIVLPNPQYGSWEGALYDFDYSLSRPDILRRKRGRLFSAPPAGE